MNFTFNEQRKDYILVTRVRRPYRASLRPNIITVPGMHGGYVASIDIEPLIIPVKIEVSGDTREKYFNNCEEVAEWLTTNEPKPLVFDDQPDRIYYAMLLGSLEPEEIVRVGYVDVKFICPDPYKYGPEKVVEPSSDTFIVENNGTAETYPIITLTANEPTTFAMVSNSEEYMMVGRPYNIEKEQPFQKYQRIFTDDASSLVGWTTGTTVDGGVVAGQMQAANGRFEAVSYGTGTNWHGPAIKTSIPEIVEDFRFQTFISMANKNSPAYVGRVEVYLLDNLGNTVAKLAIKDTQTQQALTFAEVRIGDMSNYHYLINEYGDRPGNWNDFYGILRIEKDGNEWYAYVAMTEVGTGRHHTRRSVRWVDTENKFTRQVAQVQVHVAQYGNNPAASGGVYAMILDKINHEQDGVPYIANAGDVIVFDHKTGDAYINGEPVPFDFGADFFALKKGYNSLAVIPENTFDVGIKYRERWR